jgi:hypothetical protein
MLNLLAITTSSPRAGDADVLPERPRRRIVTLYSSAVSMSHAGVESGAMTFVASAWSMPCRRTR